MSHENVVWHWSQATTSETAQGMRWYEDAHHIAVAIADNDAHLGAGMLAIYSPQQDWTNNILCATRVLQDGKGHGGPGFGIFATTSQKNSANRLLNGEPYESILSGPKIRDFAHLIEFAGDRDPNNPRVVIDRHALSVAHGRVLASEEYAAAPLRGRRRADGSILRHHYDHVVDVFHRAAALISASTGNRVTPHQVQATTWLVRRRFNRNTEYRRATPLDLGRQRARVNSENTWRKLREHRFPHLSVAGTEIPESERISS